LGDVAPVLVVTGTKREAAVLRGKGVDVIAIAGRSEALDHLQPPISALLSFGMAGALSSDLRIGDWVIGSGLCGELDGLCDSKWSAKLRLQLPNAIMGACFADGRLIGSSAEKQNFHQTTGALFADMESHAVAKAAKRLGVPFAILRCISDEASRDLPPMIAVAMRPDGRLALGSILASLIRKPSQLLELLQTLRGFSAGFSALRDGVSGLTCRLAFDLR
jgi:adenosylhomocysteine nucleosidase